MAKRWTSKEEKEKRTELEQLYIKENLSLREVARALNISEVGVYDRFIRLGISTIPHKKPRYRNVRQDISIPVAHSPVLAEFVGVLLGDGNITKTQVCVTINQDEKPYIEYLLRLINKIFSIRPRYYTHKNSHAITIYFGSTAAVRYLLAMGLVHNKVLEQVRVPGWIHIRPEFQKAFLRGVMDTDGSVYKLRFGMQLSFTSKSRPLLQDVRGILLSLHFHPSRITGPTLYVTRRNDLLRYFQEIGFSNPKHHKRFLKFFTALGYSSLVNEATL